MAVALTARREQSRARSPDVEGYVERDGVRVFYEVYGSGARTVLLLPTWSIIHSRQWKGQIPYLARNYRVLTFDGRGNGRSDRSSEPAAYDEREFAADALAVLDATATDRAAIVGYSLGAQRGLILATEHPERVEGAVFIGPSYPGGGRPLDERARFLWEDELETDEPHSTKQIEDCVGWGLETTAETLVTAQYGRMLEPEEARSLAQRLRCPLLVVHGTADQIAHHTRGEALAEHGRGSLVLVEGGGHAPHARDPVAFNILLNEFLERLP